MKYTLPIILFIALKSFSQTPITDDNFHQAIDTCLSTNPVDGLCTDCEYGAMPEWNVTNVTNMKRAFHSAYIFNSDISSWDVSNVTDMTEIFYKATSFNQNIGDWDVNNVISMNNMFSSAKDFNQDLNNWNVSNVTDMRGMFGEASNFNQDIGNWDVSNVTNMAAMFFFAYEFNKDIGGWNVSNVVWMNEMFSDATDFNQDIGNWDVSNVIGMYSMFYNAASFNNDISNWCVEQITSYPDFFSYECPLLPEYHPNWGVECFVGIIKTELEKNIAYPNPTESSIKVDIGSRNVKEIIIYNQFNQVIFKDKTESEIDLSNFHSGIYIIEIITNENRIRQKIIKK